MQFQFKHILIIFISVLYLSSCDEDKFGDWKVLNDSWLENYIEEHKDDPDFFVTESGLCYRVIHQGYYTRPNSGSLVRAEYSGKLITGTTFDSGIFYRTLSEAIRGWQEGFPYMRDGAHFIFYVPSRLGYGDDGFGSIPPYSTLVFDVKLLKTFNY